MGRRNQFTTCDSKQIEDFRSSYAPAGNSVFPRLSVLMNRRRMRIKKIVHQIDVVSERAQARHRSCQPVGASIWQSNQCLEVAGRNINLCRFDGVPECKLKGFRSRLLLVPIKRKPAVGHAHERQSTFNFDTDPGSRERGRIGRLTSLRKTADKRYSNRRNGRADRANCSGDVPCVFGGCELPTRSECDTTHQAANKCGDPLRVPFHITHVRPTIFLRTILARGRKAQ